MCSLWVCWFSVSMFCVCARKFLPTTQLEVFRHFSDLYSVVCMYVMVRLVIRDLWGGISGTNVQHLFMTVML